MSVTRPVLLGMNNPLSSDPEHALFPYPPRCTGWRIHQMLLTRVPGVTRGEYCRAFDRRNLVSGQVWSKDAGRKNATLLLEDETLRGRTVLAFGVEVRRLLGLPAELVHPQVAGVDITFRWLPHPSGRSRWYNEKRNVTIAAMLLEELYLRSTGGCDEKSGQRGSPSATHAHRERGSGQVQRP